MSLFTLLIENTILYIPKYASVSTLNCIFWSSNKKNIFSTILYIIYFQNKVQYFWFSKFPNPLLMRGRAG